MQLAHVLHLQAKQAMIEACNTLQCCQSRWCTHCALAGAVHWLMTVEVATSARILAEESDDCYSMCSYLYRAEWLRQKVVQVRCPDQQACALVMLLQNLDESSVCQNTPVHHQQELAMKVDKAFVYSMDLLRCLSCGCIVLQAAEPNDIVFFLVQEETTAQRYSKP